MKSSQEIVLGPYDVVKRWSATVVWKQEHLWLFFRKDGDICKIITGREIWRRKVILLGVWSIVIRVKETYKSSNWDLRSLDSIWNERRLQGYWLWSDLLVSMLVWFNFLIIVYVYMVYKKWAPEKIGPCSYAHVAHPYHRACSLANFSINVQIFVFVMFESDHLLDAF